MSRIADGPDYDFGPYEDEYRGFEIGDDESGRGPLILVLALGVLLIFAGVVWNTYRQGVRPSEGGLPVITADAAPYKRAPDERGGLEVAGQDNSFYSEMDGLGDPAVVEASVRAPVNIRRDTPVLSGAPADELPPVEQDRIEETPVRSAAMDGLDVRSPQTSEAQPVRTASLQPVDLTPPRTATETIETMAPVSSITNTRFAQSGAYQVQLMALRSEAAAQDEWSKLKRRSPGLFDGAILDIQRADLGSKGVFYRLRLGTFESRENAKSFCADVKAAGKDCIVVAKATG